MAISPPSLPAHRWPWQWTYAIFLEKRWEQIADLSGIYGDEDEPEGNEFREIPKEYWHDKKRVDDWVEKAKQRRKDKMDNR